MPKLLVTDTPPWDVHEATRTAVWSAYAPALIDLRDGGYGFGHDDCERMADEVGSDDAR